MNLGISFKRWSFLHLFLLAIFISLNEPLSESNKQRENSIIRLTYVSLFFRLKILGFRCVNVKKKTLFRLKKDELNFTAKGIARSSLMKRLHMLSNENHLIQAPLPTDKMINSHIFLLNQRHL